MRPRDPLHLQVSFHNLRGDILFYPKVDFTMLVRSLDKIWRCFGREKVVSTPPTVSGTPKNPNMGI